MGKRQTPEAPRQAAPAAAPKAPLTLAALGIRTGDAGPDKPKLERNDPFLFFVHAERWMVLAGQVVPHLKRLPIRNAVCGIRQREDGTYDISKMLEVQKRKGWTMLDPMVDGVAAYLYSPSEGVWLTRWETAHVGSRHVSPDPAGFAAWLTALIKAGKIPAPAPYVLQALQAKLQSEAEHLKDKVRTVPSAQVDLEHKLAALEVVERELRRLPARPVPKSTENPLAGLLVKDAAPTDPTEPDDEPDEEDS